MGKLRPDSKFAKLTPEQRETLDRWLFVENASYNEIAVRMREQFHINVFAYQVNKFHEWAQPNYMRQRIMRAAGEANLELQKLAADDKDYLKALLNLLGQVVFERALGSQSQADLQEVRDSLRVLIAAKQEGHQAARMALQREKWEFDVSRVCLAHLAELQEIIANHSLDEHARLLAIRKRLFGENLPD